MSVASVCEWPGGESYVGFVTDDWVLFRGIGALDAASFCRLLCGYYLMAVLARELVYETRAS